MRIGVGLSIPELSTRGGRFSPLSLFTGGTVGAWYDPSDYSTLFQDSAGTTPVTAVEQPVGLMLDKSQGLVLGPQLITNGDFANSSNWVLTGNSSVSGGTGNLDGTAVAGLLYQAGIFTTGKWYQVEFDVVSITGTLKCWNNDGTTIYSTTTTGRKSFIYLHAIASSNFLFRVDLGSNIASVDNVSVKLLPGNHASQSTSTSRPVLRARYNLLTYSEQFDNAAWNASSGNTVVTPNTIIAPDGTLTADTIASDAIAAQHFAFQSPSLLANTTYTFSIYAKTASTQYLQITTNLTAGSAQHYATFDLNAGIVSQVGSSATASIQSVGNGWYRCICTMTTVSASSATTAIFCVVPTGTGGRNPSYTGSTSVYAWGADLRTGSSAGTYQRIAAATDYATAGFLPYLYFVTDDSFGTNSINFSATDAMFSCVGITKNSDAANALVYELSADLTSNNGAVNLFAPIVSGGLNTYYAASKGTVSATAGTGTGVYVAPITNVVSTVADISTPSLALRVNGSQVATSTATQGTGNYGNYPLYIGRRNNATLPLNGNIYQLIVCGKALSAAELASTEAYVATKTGVTL